MPVAARIENRVLCMHGGIPKEMSSLDQIRNIERPTDLICYTENSILRDLLWADPSPSYDLFGAPIERSVGWTPNDQRGVSYFFGSDVLDEFLTRFDLDLICRAHEVAQDGYAFFGAPHRPLGMVTIFSAPNYRFATLHTVSFLLPFSPIFIPPRLTFSNWHSQSASSLLHIKSGEHDNAAAIFSLDEDMVASITVLAPPAKLMPRKLQASAATFREEGQCDVSPRSPLSHSEAGTRSGYSAGPDTPLNNSPNSARAFRPGTQDQRNG
jgi:diadenosine tetraphosphatase ApaH/serine/threonine PP2A family protein phosphatase